MFGLVHDHLHMTLVGPSTCPVRSAKGSQAAADHAYKEALAAPVVLVPGDDANLSVPSMETNEVRESCHHLTSSAAGR